MARIALWDKQIPYSELKLDRDFSREQILEKFPEAKSFPIIVLDGFYIGGYTQLREHLNSKNDSQIQLNG
jgi:glutaredoxin